MLILARRAGIGIGGALAGALAAVYPAHAGLAFVEPYAMLAAFMLAGGIAGFVGVDIGPPAGTAVRGPKTTADSVDMLSVAGTLIANSSALLAALLVVLEAQPKITWAITLGFWWLFGVTAQIAAGILARLRAIDPTSV